MFLQFLLGTMLANCSCFSVFGNESKELGDCINKISDWYTTNCGKRVQRDVNLTNTSVGWCYNETNNYDLRLNQSKLGENSTLVANSTHFIISGDFQQISEQTQNCSSYQYGNSTANYIVHCLSTYLCEPSSNNTDVSEYDLLEYLSLCEEDLKTTLMYQNCILLGNDSTCDSCKSGWFGDKCENRCSQHCKEKHCNKNTGMCTICEHGWFGNKCQDSCLQNCKMCLDNTTCIECIDGLFGRNCDQNCSAKCIKCLKDGERCTECQNYNYYGDKCSCKAEECNKYNNSLYCTECKQPGWYPSIGGCCPCSNNCAGGYTNCDNLTGTCFDGCQLGYYGSRCQDRCSLHCIGNDSLCDSVTGECKYGCKEDWVLPTCNFECSLFYPYCEKCLANNQNVICSSCIDGYYMPHKYMIMGLPNAYLSNYCFPCDHCKNRKCDGNTGLCTEGCEVHGRFNSEDFIQGKKYCILECTTCLGMSCNSTDGICLDGCEAGYYGDKCNLQCSDTCLNRTCEQKTGECFSCEANYYGPTCNMTCGRCTDGVCNRLSGRCKGGCLHGYYKPTCQKHCNGCVGDVCDVTGECVYGCKPGKYGTTCENICSDYCFICHHMTGACILSNSTNLTSIDYSNISMEPCQTGSYGIECNVSCGIGCKRTKASIICQKFTGYCHDCLDGYHGDTCDDRCNRTCSERKCSRNATCLKGCINRWQGIYCQNHFPMTAFEQYSGIGFGALCFTVSSIVIIVVLRKQRTNRITRMKKKKAAAQNHSEEKNTVV